MKIWIVTEYDGEMSHTFHRAFSNEAAANAYVGPDPYNEYEVEEVEVYDA